MTGDLGPGETPSEALSAVFEPHLIAVAGLARERGADEVAALLDSRTGVDVAFAESPITVQQDDVRALVDVIVRVPAEHAALADAQRHQAIELLNEAARADGYRVRDLEARPDPSS